MNKEYLKSSIKKNERYQKKQKKNIYVNETLLNVVEKFIKKNKRICYGGTAINTILPKDQQFYDYDIDIPDYDFFTPNAIEDAKTLCNLLKKENIFHVEGKNAVIYGTYKVFVNFVPIADCTQVDPSFYDYLLKNSIEKDGILYTPPSFLRMSLHQELARPLGDVTRWEKIYERMNLLNLYYPVLSKSFHKNHNSIIKLKSKEFAKNYDELFNYFQKNNHVFCNLHMIACKYKKYVKTKYCLTNNDKDMYIIYCDDLNITMNDIQKMKLPNINIELKESHYKFISNYVFMYYKKRLIGILFQTNSCLSYIESKHKNKKIYIGNIDTLMNLYFSFLLMDDISVNERFIISILSEMNKVIIHYDKYTDNPNDIPKILNRFNLPCYGKQNDFQSILKERYKKYKELNDKKSSVEYKKWFFKYTPNLSDKDNVQTKKNQNSSKKNKTLKLSKKRDK